MVIICKLFEIIKSYIIILSVNCNAHLHTLSENKNILNGENAVFGTGPTDINFFADRLAGGSKI